MQRQCRSCNHVARSRRWRWCRRGLQRSSRRRLNLRHTCLRRNFQLVFLNPQYYVCCDFPPAKAAMLRAALRYIRRSWSCVLPGSHVNSSYLGLDMKAVVVCLSFKILGGTIIITITCRVSQWAAPPPPRPAAWPDGSSPP